MMNTKVLVVLLLCSVITSSVEGLSFHFGQWEYCYGEPASNQINVENAFVRVVQSPNHRLGFQVHLNITTNEPIDQAMVNLRTWHEQTGDRYKYGDSDACCGFFSNNEDGQCASPDSETHCPVSGAKNGMIERLFAEERDGNFEAQIQLFDTSEERQEVMCLQIPFEITESFLSQFQRERKEKLEAEKPILLL